MDILNNPFGYEISKELEMTLRNIALVGDKSIKPYETSNISILHLPVAAINPTAFYVLKEHLAFLEDLSQRLNIFELADITEIDGGLIAPPVVEVHDGKFILVDGQHRLFLAKNKGVDLIKCIVIFNPSVPLAVLPVDWREVGVYEEKPAISRRYNLSLENPSAYYRDLQILGSSGQRRIKVCIDFDDVISDKTSYLQLYADTFNNGVLDQELKVKAYNDREFQLEHLKLKPDALRVIKAMQLLHYDVSVVTSRGINEGSIAEEILMLNGLSLEVVKVGGESKLVFYSQAGIVIDNRASHLQEVIEHSSKPNTLYLFGAEGENSEGNIKNVKSWIEIALLLGIDLEG